MWKGIDKRKKGQTHIKSSKINDSSEFRTSTRLLRATAQPGRSRGLMAGAGSLGLGGKFVLDLCHHYGRFLFFGRFWRSGFRVTTDKSEPDKRGTTVFRLRAGRRARLIVQDLVSFRGSFLVKSNLTSGIGPFYIFTSKKLCPKFRTTVFGKLQPFWVISPL